MIILITGYLVAVSSFVSAGIWGKKDLAKISIMIGLAAAIIGSLETLGEAVEWSIGEWNVLAVEKSKRFLQVGEVEKAFIATLGIVATVIICFSAWYMSHEPFLKYFELVITSFAGAMMFFIISQDIITLITFWEGIGIASFLLIGYYTTRLEANKAAIKAVVMNKIGDVGLMILMAVMLSTTGTKIVGGEPLTGVTIFMLMALAAKSAQFGLHGWLTDAMEGPTPVSALLHSATMVTAGVFMAFKLSGLVEAGQAVVIIGGLTTLFSALAAISEMDVKKLIAFSTCANLGLMTIGLENKLVMDHLLAHATFKSTLFMISGIMIHAYLSQDIRRIGGAGARSFFPLETTMLLICGIANAGTLYTAGNFTKEEILTKGIFDNLRYTPSLLIIAGIIIVTVLYVLKLTQIQHGIEKSKVEFSTKIDQELVGTRIGLAALTIAAIVGGRLVTPDFSAELTTNWNLSGILALVCTFIAVGFMVRKKAPNLSLKKWYDLWTNNISGGLGNATKEINLIVEKGLVESGVGGLTKSVIMKKEKAVDWGIREMNITMVGLALLLVIVLNFLF